VSDLSDGPTVCEARGYLPAILVPLTVSLERFPDRATADDPERHLRCALETHTDDRHCALVLKLGEVSTGSVWASWSTGRFPETVGAIADCLAIDSDTNEPCSGYSRHPGRHSFKLHDPLDELSRTLSY